MDMWKSELTEEEYKILKVKPKNKVVDIANHQTGKTNRKVDLTRHALPPGKRISKSGKIYWESRKNRSDMPGTSI